MSTSSEKAKKLLQFFEKVKPWDQVLKELAIKDDGIENQLSIPGLLSWSKESF
ncbi:MAG: hypothetical protein HYZ42_12970, partial [Bacteroidetes bacterium]|nr:hypothetical protein [Bacteroidota bacterium]